MNRKIEQNQNYNTISLKNIFININYFSLQIKYLLEKEQQLDQIIKNNEQKEYFLFKIQDLSQENLKYIIEIAFQNMINFDHSRRKTEQSFNSKHSYIIYLKNQEKIIAFIVFRLISEYKINQLYIYEYHSVKEYQHQGLGSKLLDYVCILMKKLNLNTIKLTVYKSNKQALSFYKKHQFQLAPESWTDEDEQNFYILEKILKN